MLDSSILVQIKHFSHSYLERSQIDLGTWFLTSALTIKLIQALFRILWILFILLGDAHMHVHFTCSFVMTHGEESACDAGDLGLISGLGRSPGEGNGCPLQYSGLENSMDCSLGSQRVRHDWVTFTFTFKPVIMVSIPLCSHRWV